MMDFLNVKKLNFLVIGDLMIDSYINGSTNKISAEAPVPIVLVTEQIKKLGGAGNVINNLLSLGINVSVVGCVGNDSNGNWIKKELEKSNVNTENLKLSDNRITTVKTRISSRNQQLIRYDEEITDCLNKNDEDSLLNNNLLENIDAVIISDYGKGVVTFNIAQTIIKEAAQKNIYVFVDPKGNNYDKYHGATVCTPNMNEFNDVIGCKINSEEEIKKYGLALCEQLDLKYLLLTRSEKGLTLLNNSYKKKTDFPAQAKEVVDVTGAGDTVISVFALCYTLGINISDCCKIANIAASDVISKFGTATTTIEKIINLSENMKSDKNE